MPKIINPEVEICQMYMQHGKCTWGPSCKFAHISANNIKQKTKKNICNMKPQKTMAREYYQQRETGGYHREMAHDGGYHREMAHDGGYHREMAHDGGYQQQQYQMWVMQQARLLAVQIANNNHDVTPRTNAAVLSVSAPSTFAPVAAIQTSPKTVDTISPKALDLLKKISLDENSQQYYDQTITYMKFGIRGVRKYAWLSNCVAKYVTGCGISLKNMTSAISVMENQFSTYHNNGNTNSDEYYQSIGFLKAVYATFAV